MLFKYKPPGTHPRIYRIERIYRIYRIPAKTVSGHAGPDLGSRAWGQDYVSYTNSVKLLLDLRLRTYLER